MSDADDLPARLPGHDYRRLFHEAPIALIVIDARTLVMTEANAAYLQAVGRSADQIIGRRVFDAFPAGDDAFDLQTFFIDTILTGTRQVAAGVRYDIPGSETTSTETRWWNVIEVPLLDDVGEAEWLLHYTEDVTDLIRTRDELAHTEQAREDAARRAAGLSDVSLALSSAVSLAEVESAVLRHGLQVLDGDACGLITRSSDGNWQATTSEQLSDAQRDTYLALPYLSEIPAAVSARTGRRFLFPTRASGEAYGPSMQQLYADTQWRGWAFLPLVVEGTVVGSLSIAWVEEHHTDPAELEVLEAFAAQCATAVHRIRAAEAEHRTVEQLADLAEALRQALLTPPADSGELQVAVRYRSAVDAAQVGGDWYDSFAQRDGRMIFVIGDVIGHDSVAAAAMGQLRSVLRVLAHTADADVGRDTPAGILRRTETVARDLGVDALATAVVVRVEHEASGRRRICWSNAGHPPPILLHADGRTELLEPKPNLLLGLGQEVERLDHLADFPDGATLLLYTDGLIERRDTGLEEGIADLCTALSAAAGHSVEQVCDLVLERLAPHTGEDDIAMLAVRAGPPA